MALHSIVIFGTLVVAFGKLIELIELFFMFCLPAIGSQEWETSLFMMFTNYHVYYIILMNL